MAWYKEAQELGYVVRGEIEQDTNSFPSYEVWRLGGEGENKVKNDADCYIQLSGKHRNDRIVCLTADVKYCRKHNYMMCGFSFGGTMNTLRDCYVKNVGKLQDICRVEADIDKNGKQKLDKDGNEKFRNVWFNDKMVKLIIENTPIDKIDIFDGEVYVESYDLEFLAELFLVKKTKKKKNPFHDDYLDWSNKHKVPEDELAKFSELYQTICNGDNFAGVKIIKDANDKLREKHPRKLSKANKRLSRIKDFKAFIHYSGYWDDYIEFLSALV